jgi:hypothetical protein
MLFSPSSPRKQVIHPKTFFIKWRRENFKDKIQSKHSILEFGGQLISKGHFDFIVSTKKTT